MPWIHDETATPDAPNGTLQCVSEKHGRNLTIKLPAKEAPLEICCKCWRACAFATHEDGTVHHYFNSQKSTEGDTHG